MRRQPDRPALPCPGPRRCAEVEWGALRKLGPYLWQWRWRVLVALGFLVAAKLANVGVPLVLKQIVDALDPKPGDPRRCWWCRWAAGGLRLLRVSVTLFTELRELIFYPVAARARAAISLRPSSTCSA